MCSKVFLQWWWHDGRSCMVFFIHYPTFRCNVTSLSKLWEHRNVPKKIFLWCYYYVHQQYLNKQQQKHTAKRFTFRPSGRRQLLRLVPLIICWLWPHTHSYNWPHLRAIPCRWRPGNRMRACWWEDRPRRFHPRHREVGEAWSCRLWCPGDRKNLEWALWSAAKWKHDIQ